jgi:hypothetical protein
MPSRESSVVRQRLRNQQLAGTTFTTPADLVGWFGAVQSQDYPGARWALGQRIAGGSTDAAIARAFDDGAILRTHVLRPTWHFVTPADIRWLMALTGPRIERVARYYQEAVGLDARLRSRGRSVILRALGAGQHLTRVEIMTALTRAGIAVTGQALGHLLFHVEADALVCSGPARGRLPTYALLDARVPTAAPVDRDRALAELARRYFQSHGPATVADYVWWSGLTAGDARAGIAIARPWLEREVIEGTEYWIAPSTPARSRVAPAVHLLPNYDELLVAYRDRSASIEPPTAGARGLTSQDVLTNVITVAGRVAGTWQRVATKAGLSLRARLRRPLTPAEHRRLDAAVGRYSTFLDAPVSLSVEE